jgi:low temperature requirement protein LtrA
MAAERAGQDEVRVSTLELFFDLVFVFTVTQLTYVLVHHPDGEGLAQVVLMLTVIWWMYGAFAWLTNAVPPDRARLRIPMLAGMAAFFAIALTIPTAFEEDGVVFACAYLAVVVIHAGLYSQSASWSLASILAFARMNFLAGLLILAGTLIGGGWEYVLWGLTIPIFAIVPALITEDPGWIRPGHFVERHGLVVIVALGESVVAIGIGASELDLSVELVAVAILGLALSGLLWWTYFGGDEEEAERALTGTEPTRRSFLLVNAGFYWAHVLILLAIVAVAAGLEHAIGHPYDPLDFAFALALGGGAALFYLGDSLFRACIGLEFRPWRAAAVLLALATIPIGTETTALAQITVLVALLGACAALEGEPSG